MRKQLELVAKQEQVLLAMKLNLSLPCKIEILDVYLEFLCHLPEERFKFKFKPVYFAWVHPARATVLFYSLHKIFLDLGILIYIHDLEYQALLSNLFQFGRRRRKTSLCMRAHTHTHTCTHMHIHLHTCVYSYTYTHTFSPMCILIHIHLHACTCVCVHARARSWI